MSKGPGGMTVTINCMIIAGFPGIGKSTTYAEMKAGLATARVAEMASTSPIRRLMSIRSNC